MSKLIKTAIVGCGVIAPLHAASYQRVPEVEVAWACDTVLPKAEKLAEEYGIPQVTAEYRDLLADPQLDCVSICTPHVDHAPIVVDALRAGKHVLCEKPLATTPEDLTRMLEVYEEAREEYPGLVFAGVFQHRFDKVYQYVRQLVKEGAFGTLLTANMQLQCLRTEAYYHSDAWRGTWVQEGGSLMINQAIHFVDTLGWVMGGVDSLCAYFENRTHQGVIETEDTVAVALRFTSGALGTIAATSSSHLTWEPTFSIYGTEGSIAIRNGEAVRVAFVDPEREAAIKAVFADGEEVDCLDVGKSYYGPSHTSQIADFIAAIREERDPFVPAAAARHAVDIVLGIYKSQQEQGWVKITGEDHR